MIYPCFFYEGSYEEFYWILERSIGINIESALARIGIAWEMLPENKDDHFHKTQQLNFDTIIFSAGKIGYQVEVNLEDLKKVIEFQLAEICV